jgi:hypothetical protein
MKSLCFRPKKIERPLPKKQVQFCSFKPPYKRPLEHFSYRKNKEYALLEKTGFSHRSSILGTHKNRGVGFIAISF